MPQKPEDPAARAQLEKLMHDLWQDAQSGDLDRSRQRLMFHTPRTARRAVVHLGIPYLEKIKQLGDAAQIDNLSGPAAIERFIEQTLKPVVAAKTTAPPVKSKPPSAAVQKKKVSGMRRAVSRLALSAALGISLATGAWLYQTTPSQSAIPTPAVTNITELRQEFTRTAMGTELLEMADAHGITIEYDPTLTERKRLAEYSAAHKKATVRPDLSADDQIVYLAHELRHAWQDIVIGYDEMEDRLLTPSQRWVLRRFIEADAAAYSAVFLAERMRDMGQTHMPADSGAYFEYTLARALLDEYTSPDGLTHTEYRTQILAEAFDNLASYDPQHLALATNGMLGLSRLVQQAKQHSDAGQFGHARIVLDHLDALLATTPTEAEFDTWLRQMGGTSLDTRQPTALQDPDVSPQKLFNTYAGLGVTAVQAAAHGTAEDTAGHIEKLRRADNVHAGFLLLVKQLRALNDLRQEMAALPSQPAPRAAPANKAIL